MPSHNEVIAACRRLAAAARQAPKEQRRMPQGLALLQQLHSAERRNDHRARADAAGQLDRLVKGRRLSSETIFQRRRRAIRGN